MRMAGAVVCVVAMMTLWSGAAVSASSPSSGSEPVIVADVAGRSIKPELIPSFYCHDFDYPRIHCFPTAVDLERAETARAQRVGASTAFSASDYVTIFDGAIYSGGYMDVSQNYDALFSIGWNDRISSYKARNSASGIFWTDWFASGTGRTFCCNTNVSSLPSGLDDAFSSVYRR